MKNILRVITLAVTCAALVMLSGSCSALNVGPPSPPVDGTTSNAVPSAPINLNITSMTESAANLQWQAGPITPTNSPPLGYYIERALLVGSTNFSTVGTNTGANATTYLNFGLSPATTYRYQVRAWN